MNVVKVREIAIGDLVEIKDNVGVITDISKKGLCLTTINDDIKIFCKDIKAIRFLPPKCLRHGNRNCSICNQKIFINTRYPTIDDPFENAVNYAKEILERGKE